LPRKPSILSVVHSISVAAPANEAVLYRIDASDTVVEVGGGWDAFAELNGGIGEVVGRPLWHFIAGDDVRAVWQLLLRHVRADAEPLVFLYRCDAPGLRRLMQMELRSDSDDSVQFRSHEVRAHAAPTVGGRWDTGSRRETVTVCGWCGRVRTDGWVSPDDAIDLLGLTLPQARSPRLTHGICETCARDLNNLAHE